MKKINIICNRTCAVSSNLLGVYKMSDTIICGIYVITYQYFTQKLEAQENGTYLNILTHICRHSSKVRSSKAGQNVIP